MSDLSTSQSLRHAPAPAASPRARWWTILLGILLIAAGGVAVHDLLVDRGTLSADYWLRPVFNWVAEVHYSDWVMVAAIGSALLAIILFFAAVRPRTRTHTSFGGDSELYARPVDIARMGTAAAQRCGGVLRASTVATRKKIAVTVTTAASDSAEQTSVNSAVTDEVQRLAGLLHPVPTVTVKIVSPAPGGERK